MIISEQEALEVLDPYTAMLYEIVYSAWAEYPKIYSEVLQKHTPRSKSSLIHDHMVYNAREMFDNVPGVRCMDSQRLFLMNFHGKVLIRFKKLYDDKMPRNIQTQQTLLFSRQMEIPQIPSATHLVVGYELDATQVALRSISIACPYGTQNQWFSELNAPSTSEFKSLDRVDTTKDRKKLVTAKKIQEVKENNE